MYTPNLDSLASRSLVLERAYVQQALCGPSRASLLTGRRPDTTHVYQCGRYFREKGGNFTTIPQYFKMNGYRSIGMGKVFHSKGKNSGGDDPVSWSEPYFHGIPNYEEIGKSWAAIPDKELQSKPLLDDQTAKHAIVTLRKLATDVNTDKRPFFLAVGFRRPHLPFVFPKSFLKYYPDVHLPDNPNPPSNMPSVAWNSFGRFTNYIDVKYTGPRSKAKLTKESTLSLRRAYYSSVTWVDHLIGNILQELDDLGLSNNTIISFIGDHGYQLGEHGEWGKQTNFELSNHAPMMIHIPGKTNQGIRSKSLVEFVDLFPTLVDSVGLKQLPLCPQNSANIESCREGISFLPLINEPSKPIREAAFSQYPRQNYMGYSIKTDRYRYTEWPLFDNIKFKPKWSKSQRIELYDHKLDPEENINRAFDKSYDLIKQRLSKILREGWKRSLINSLDGTENKTHKFLEHFHNNKKPTITYYLIFGNMSFFIVMIMIFRKWVTHR
jgi:iduronate 2-sulfatase